MEPIHKREDQELVNVIRNAAIKLWDAEDGPNVRAALDELERRHCNKGSVLARLARVEEDLAVFKREHAERIFPGTGAAALAMCRSTRTADHGLLPDGNVDPALVPSSAELRDLVGDVHTHRANAENRAWQNLVDWITHAPKNTAHSGSVYEIRTAPVSPGHGNDWDVAIWRGFWSEEKDELDSEVVVTKRGTSRVDALAHLASWCQAEMPDSEGRTVNSTLSQAEAYESDKPSPYCGHQGPCGVGVPKCVHETVKL